MVGGADLWTLRTTAAQLDTCVRMRPTNSVYNSGLLGEAAELAGWYVNVIPPPTTTLPKAKMKLTRRTVQHTDSSHPGVVPLVLPLVAARLPHPSTILLQHLGVLTTSATTFLSHRRPVRPTSTRPLYLLLPRTRRLGTRAFCIAGPAAWNSLPSDIRTASTLSTFKNHLKTHLFLQLYIL